MLIKKVVYLNENSVFLRASEQDKTFSYRTRKCLL